VIAHRLNRTLEVWRTITTDDGAGGQITDMVLVGTIRAQVSQPSVAEQVTASQAGARLDAIVHTEPGADVRRGDELRGDGETYRVTAVVSPSRPAYRRANCERIQHEGQ